MRFITGLPRSRTKWFADYFDGIDGFKGIHEPLNGCPSKEAFYTLAGRGDVVISDSALHITDFQQRFPDHKTVIIERDIDEVFGSLKRFFASQGLPLPSYEHLKHQAAETFALDGLRVRFEDIDDRLEEIHEYLGVPYNLLYAKFMGSQNIQMPSLSVDDVSVSSYEMWAPFAREAG